MHKTRAILSTLTLGTLVAACTPDDEPNEDTTQGTPCSVEENGDGTVTIECPDGSSVTVSQGSAGTPGRDGKEGGSGDRGEPGDDGQEGDPGEDGALGEDGAPGEEGAPGEDGEVGQEGSQGEPGLEGTPGENGQDGELGLPGGAGIGCSVECVDEHTARVFCDDDSEISYQVESCTTPPVNLLSARAQHGCWILPTDRRLVCWGSDSIGGLGNGPIKVDQARANLVDTRLLDYGLSTRWRSVDTGKSASCGITAGGEAYCWGSSLALGNGGVFSEVPTPVDTSSLPPGTTWSVISPGNGSADHFSCGVTSEGTAYCWGSDSSGNLGNGGDLILAQLAPSPVDISALSPETTWSVVSTGSSHACGLTSEGVAYCWGSDADGRLGNGPALTAAEPSPSPVDLSGLPPETTWTAISAGFDHTCALTTEGQAYCWGKDAHEQLGNGALGAASSPNLVDTTSFAEGVTFAQLSAGEQHSCGLTSDGSAWCWGNRAGGRVGDGGSQGNAPSPVAVDVSLLPGGTSWKTLSVGMESSCGLTVDDEVYCWGSDSSGQLGIGALISLPQLRPRLAVAASIAVLIEHSEFSGAVGADNPELPLTVLSLASSTEELTVTATSGNAGIIPSANITVTGTGSDRLLSFTPIASGLVMITVVVASSEGEYTLRLEYGASAAPPDPTGVYYHHVSDASTALDVGDGYVLLGNDETNTLFLHEQDVSGLPVEVWNFTAAEQLGIDELDIEAAARSGDTIVWTASHGNSSKNAGLEERRRAIFATKITGSGANVELSFAGRYGGGPGSKSEVADLGLRADLVSWDQADGHGMGADALGFEAGTASGVFPVAPSGFNIEALEFAADGTTGYLGFRAPTIDVGGTQHALIVPVTNILELVDGIGEQSGQAEFGAPILLDLAGRSIRAMRRNESGEYLISAGPPADAIPGVNDTWALYSWAGGGQPAVYNRALPDVDLLTGGTWESIAVVPNPLESGGIVRLVTDSGDTVMYGFEQTKDVALGHQKSFSQLFTLE